MAAAAKKLTKMDRLRISVGAHADESMGAGKGKKVLHGATISPPVASRWDGVRISRDVAIIPVGLLIPDPDQPRTEFDPEEIEVLSRSLVDRGQLQPIRVRWLGPVSRWAIVAGERRWKAALMAGLETLDCVVDDESKDHAERLVDQIVENCCRVDLSPMDQARAFRRVMEAKSCTSAEVARLAGTSKSSVARALALLDLPDLVTDAVESGDLAPSVAYEISKLGTAEEQHALAETALSNGWSRSQVAEEVRRITEPASPAPPSVAPCNDEGIRTSTSKALPDWRDRPATGLGFPERVMNLLIGSEIETAGEAWGLLATGHLVEGMDWSVEDARLLEFELLRLREKEGDTDPFYRPLPLPPGPAVTPAPGEGRDVPRRKFQEGAIRIVEPAPPPAPEVAEWDANPFTDDRRLILAEVEGVAIVALAEDDAPDVRVLAPLREAIARIESRMGIAPRHHRA